MPRSAKGKAICPHCKNPGSLNPCDRQWWCPACEVPFYSSAVKPGDRRVPLEEFRRLSAEALAEAARAGKLMVDFWIPAGTGTEDGYSRMEPVHNLYLVIDGPKSSVCPDADPTINPKLLAEVEKGLRQRGRLAAGKTIHWVGEQRGIGHQCCCFMAGETAPPPIARPPAPTVEYCLSGDG
jgi:hypothetical protein